MNVWKQECGASDTDNAASDTDEALSTFRAGVAPMSNLAFTRALARATGTAPTRAALRSAEAGWSSLQPQLGGCCWSHQRCS